jgi:PAS domain S-box-containing protein
MLNAMAILSWGTRLPRWAAYALAFALTLACTWIRWTMDGVLGDNAPMLVFSIGITAAALLAGLGPGLLATFLSVVAAVYFFVPPRFSFAGLQSGPEQLRVALFLTQNGLVCFAIGLVQRAFHAVSSLDAGRKEAEGRARQGEEQLRLLTDRLPAFLAEIDRELRYRFVNEFYAKYYGRRPDEILGRHISEVVGETVCERITPLLKRSLDGEELVFVHDVPALDGTPHRVRATYRPRLDATTGEVNGVIVHAVDISELHATMRKLAKREYELEDLVDRLKAARSEAERANAAKDQFLAALSHELRTPLTPVLFIADGLADDPAVSDEIREDMRTVARNIRFEARLIDDLLDLTRIVRGKIELHKQRVDLHAVITYALETCLEQDGAGGPVPRLNLCATRTLVVADEARLSQVVWNLVKNARKFTPQSGEVYVETYDREEGHVVVRVRDTGAGIDPEILPRIFQAFEQGGREITRRHGGLGLGLAISKAIIELHGGTLTAHSDGPGEGAMFTIELLALDETVVVEAPGNSSEEREAIEC